MRGAKHAYKQVRGGLPCALGGAPPTHMETEGSGREPMLHVVWPKGWAMLGNFSSRAAWKLARPHSLAGELVCGGSR